MAFELRTKDGTCIGDFKGITADEIVRQMKCAGVLVKQTMNLKTDGQLTATLTEVLVFTDNRVLNINKDVKIYAFEGTYLKKIW